MKTAIIGPSSAEAIAARGALLGQKAHRRRIVTLVALIGALWIGFFLFGSLMGVQVLLLLYGALFLCSWPSIQAISAFHKGQYARADSSIKRAIESNVKYFPFTSWVFGSAIDVQVRLWLRQAKFIEAEALLRLCWAALERNPVYEGTPKNMLLANSLALSYLGQHRYSEARVLFAEILPQAKNSKAQAVIRNNLAYAQFKEGLIDEAYANYKALLSEVKERNKFDRTVSAYVKCNLARVCAKKGAFEEGELLAAQALRLREIDRKSADEQAISYVALAEIQAAQGRYDEAELNLKNAVMLFRGAIAPDHPLLIEALKELAVVSKHLGKPKEAHAAIDEAIECRASLVKRQQDVIGPLMDQMSSSLPLISFLGPM